ncbi:MULTISPECIES: acyl carrier protein [unclassified Exiguobacterium]|uniref:acyl carrier protein n=1 Tax=unclassified Exiguobacterium TaxID=2644629 RepID=UPI001BE8724E|nr:MULTISPECIES: acyl carrier protein [unclassified Exiguobacterium]
MSKLEVYNMAFRNGLELEGDVVLEEMKLGESTEWDSIGHMTLIAEIEDAFDVYIDSDEMTEFHSYKSGIALLQRLGMDIKS